MKEEQSAALGVIRRFKPERCIQIFGKCTEGFGEVRGDTTERLNVACAFPVAERALAPLLSVGLCWLCRSLNTVSSLNLFQSLLTTIANEIPARMKGADFY